MSKWFRYCCPCVFLGDPEPEPDRDPPAPAPNRRVVSFENPAYQESDYYVAALSPDDSADEWVRCAVSPPPFPTQ